LFPAKLPKKVIIKGNNKKQRHFLALECPSNVFYLDKVHNGQIRSLSLCSVRREGSS